ncbi:MAG TPA: hypothetical protein VIL21_03735 [Solirubrobacterales bacterium]|jgi:hypothetical protein
MRWVAGFLVALGMLGSAPVARGITLLPPLEGTFIAGVIPTRISKTEPAPVSLGVSERIRMSDESHPPALKELRLQLDRHLRPALKGLPVCRRGSLDVRPPDLSACKDAIVGRGKMATEIAFPERPVIRQTDELIAYNTGTKDGVSSLLLYVRMNVPTPAEIAVPMKIMPVQKGRYGTEAVATVPKIAGGSGSVTYLGIRFRKGIFSAVCRDGRLHVRSEATFADGTLLGGTVVRACRPAD